MCAARVQSNPKPPFEQRCARPAVRPARQRVLEVKDARGSQVVPDIDMGLRYTTAKIDGDHREHLVRPPAIRNDVLPGVVACGSDFQYAPGALVKHGVRGKGEHAPTQVGDLGVGGLIRPSPKLHRRSDAAPFWLTV